MPRLPRRPVNPLIPHVRATAAPPPRPSPVNCWTSIGMDPFLRVIGGTLGCPPPPPAAGIRRGRLLPLAPETSVSHQPPASPGRGAVSAANRRSASVTACGLRSHPNHLRPSFLAATRVVPLPQNGSATRSP